MTLPEVDSPLSVSASSDKRICISKITLRDYVRSTERAHAAEGNNIAFRCSLLLNRNPQSPGTRAADSVPEISYASNTKRVAIQFHVERAYRVSTCGNAFSSIRRSYKGCETRDFAPYAPVFRKSAL